MISDRYRQKPCTMNEPTRESPEVASSPASPFRLPRDTTPTWEVELLLSGALVFSMLQVPGLIDGFFDSARPRLEGSGQYAAMMLYLYLKVSSYALIVTFVLHLATRAVWVAALGLRSVYPEGILWERLKRGPAFRDYCATHVPTLDRTIDEADNRASLVFASGLLLVLMSLAIMVFTLLLVALSVALSLALGSLTGLDSDGFMIILLGILLVPSLLASLVDRYVGERLPVGHWSRRWLAGIYRASAWTIWGSVTQPFLLTLFSRVGMARGNIAMLAALYLLMAVAVGELLVRTGTIDMPGEQHLPQYTTGLDMRARHYAASRSREDTLDGHPFIEAEVVRGPYLRVFVPYVARRIDPLIARDCPQAVAPELPDEADGAARRELVREQALRLLACASERLHPLTLNGESLAGVRYDFGEDPLSGLRGFVAMVPVEGLAPGRHHLEIARLSRLDDKEPPPPASIPFWR
jgi:hypothetical protein